MYNVLHYFSGPVATAVALPFNLNDIVSDWDQLRHFMIQEKPPEFERDEWAYLITFLEEIQLKRVFTSAFGETIEQRPDHLGLLQRPRGQVAMWLPSNISLLGPLMVILISLSGNPLQIKGGSRSDDLTGIFQQFAVNNLSEGSLRHYLTSQVNLNYFDHDDERNNAMAMAAKVRIFFGGDIGAAAVDQLPHPIDSIGIYFTDRRSEAWIDPEVLTEQTIIELIKVFAIYGQAGCTSPHRTILLNADKARASHLARHILDIWPSILNTPPATHVASSNIMTCQWAASLGWEAECVTNNAAVVVVGPMDLQIPEANMILPITWASQEECVQKLPPNIQTIGYALKEPRNDLWLKVVAGTAIKRFVPLSTMHHFGPTWDGYSFWRQLFEEIETF